MKLNILNISVTLFGNTFELTIPMIIGMVLVLLIVIAVIGAFVNSSIQMKVSLLMDSETRVYNRQGLHKLLKKNHKYVDRGILVHMHIKNLDRLYDYYPDKSMLMYKLTNLIISHLDKKDLIARADFDEYVMAFKTGTADEIKTLLKEINEAFLTYEVEDYGTYPFDIEFGLLDTQALDSEVKELDKKADVISFTISKCMDVIEFSQNRDGNIYIYSDEVRVAEKLIENIMNARDEAFQSKKFVNVYTPKISFKTGKVVGAEVGVRWSSGEDGEAFSKNDFDRIFANSSFIKKIDYEMLQNSIEFIKSNSLSAIPEYTLTMKLSPFDFESREFNQAVEQLLQTSAINPKHIEISLSDNDTYLKIDEFAKIVDKIKSFGFKIAVNNVGKEKISLAALVLSNFNSIFLDDIYTINNLDSDRDKVFFRNSIEMLELSTENIVVRGVNNEDTLKEIAKVSQDVYLEGEYFGIALRKHRFTSMCSKVYKFDYPEPLKYVLSTDLVVKNESVDSNTNGGNTTINVHQDNSEIAELRKQMESMRRSFEDKLDIEREKNHQMEIDNLKRQIAEANNRNNQQPMYQQYPQNYQNPYDYHLNNEILELRKQIMDLKGSSQAAQSSDVDYLKSEVERLRREKEESRNQSFDDLQAQIRELKESQQQQPQLDVNMIIDKIRGNSELNKYLDDSRREREELRNSLEQERKEREELEKMIAELNQEEEEPDVDEDTIIKDQELANQNINLNIEDLSEDENDEDDDEDDDDDEPKNLQKPNLSLNEVEAVINSYKQKYNDNWNVKAKEELKDGYYEIVNGLLYYRGRQKKNLPERIKAANPDVKHLYNIVKNE